MIGIFPIIGLGILILLGLFSAIFLKIFTRITHGGELKIRHVTLFAAPLVLMHLIYCFYLSIKVGLLHGDRLLNLFLPLQATMSFLVMVALPVGLLLFCRFHRSRRIARASMLTWGTFLFLSMIWYTPGYKASLVDELGRPVKTAFVLYHKDRFFLFSNWTTFTLTRANETGRFIIPAHIQFQLPFEYWIPFAKRITWTLNNISLYAPDLHNFSSFHNADFGMMIENPHRVSIKKWKSKNLMTLQDMTPSPEDRFDLLFSFLFKTSFLNLKAPERDIKALLSSMKEEYRSFATEYSNSPRKPPMRKDLPGSYEDEQSRLWTYYLEMPVNGKTMEQRIREVEESIIRLMNSPQ